MSAQFRTVGMLHPGSMGAAIGRQLSARGIHVLWSPAGRSEATFSRAKEAGLAAVPDLATLVAQADVIISLCPPAAAEGIARDVASYMHDGLIYVEANAITPQRVRRIEQILHRATLVDAAVVGSPPGHGRPPRLYVSGPPRAVEDVSMLFDATAVSVRVLGAETAKASALKMAYTTFQKTSRVLAAIAYATADANGLGDELLEIAALRPGSYLNETDYIPTTAALAWRWGPELTEAADYAQETGFPGDIMRAAAKALSRWDEVQDIELSLPEVLARLQDAPSVTLAHGMSDTTTQGGA